MPAYLRLITDTDELALTMFTSDDGPTPILTEEDHTDTSPLGEWLWWSVQAIYARECGDPARASTMRTMAYECRRTALELL